MKRIIAFVTAVLILVSVLSACGVDNKQKSVSLEKLLDDINAEMGISESTIEGLNIIKTEQDLKDNYNITSDQITQFAAERTSSKKDYMELVMVEAKDDESLKKIVDQMNSRLDAQLSTAKSYNPEAVDVLESCKVTTKGNYIYLVISKKQEEIENIIEKALS